MLFLCATTLNGHPLSGLSYLLFTPFGTFTVCCIIEQLLDCKAEVLWSSHLIPFVCCLGLSCNIGDVRRVNKYLGHLASQEVPLPSAHPKPSLKQSGCRLSKMSSEGTRSLS